MNAEAPEPDPKTAKDDKPARPGRRFLTNPTEGIKPYLLLTIFCAVLFLPGLGSLPPLDRDEARFAQATAQMLETGDFIDIRFQDQARHKKPAGIHWLQAASVTVFSSPDAREIWAYRVPSVIGAWLAVLMTFALGALLFDRRAAMAAGAMMAASVLLILEAHQAKTDAMLLATIMGQQYALARFYLAARTGETPPGLPVALLFWLSLAASVMIKGPIGPLISAITLVVLSAFDRNWRWLGRLGWLWGLPVACALALPWYLAISERTAGGGGETGFIMTALTTDLIPKLLGGQESHGAPPGYYALLMMIFFWPGSLLAWPALWRGWRERADPAIRFCLAWLIPAWVMFELIPTKLPHYVLPLYPALALLAGGVAAAIWAGRTKWFSGRVLAVSLGAWAVVGAILGGAAAYLPVKFGAEPSWYTAFFALFTLYVLATTWAALRHRVMNEVLENSLLSGGIMVTMVIWLMVAQFQPMWVARDAARAVTAAFQDHAQGITATAGFSEPSLVFLLGTKTKLTDGGGAAGHLLSNPDAAAVVEGRQLPAFMAGVGERAAAIMETAKISGINYSKGKRVDLHVFVHKSGGGAGKEGTGKGAKP